MRISTACTWICAFLFTGAAFASAQNLLWQETKRSPASALQPVELFRDNAETGTGQWEAQGGWALTTSKSFSPTHSWTDSPLDNYRNNANSTLTLKLPLNLLEYVEPKLSFQAQISLDYYSADFLLVEASRSKRQWTVLSQFSRTQSTADNWTSQEVNLDAFAGNDSVYIRFRLTSDGASTSDGVYLDNIAVVATPAPQIGVRLTPAPLTFNLQLGDSAVADLIIKNTGKSDLRFNVLALDEDTTGSLASRPQSVALANLIASLQARAGHAQAAALRKSNAEINFQSGATRRAQSDEAASIRFAGGKLNVALIAADYDFSIDDVRSKLLGTGLFAAVAIINTALITPTITELLSFDAVLVWRNFRYADPVNLGNILADYVDRGGGVVAAVFEVAGTASFPPLSGRWESEQYYVIARGMSKSGTSALGEVLFPAHPIMANVSRFTGGFGSYRPSTTSLTPGAQLIAKWSDGSPLVAVKKINGHRRVDLGFFPPSGSVDSYFWDPATDGATLMANALLWVAGGDFPEWFRLSASAGTVAPNDSVRLAIKVEALDLRTDTTYHKNLLIASNDPQKPVLTMPATLTVAPTNYYFRRAPETQRAAGIAGDTLNYLVTVSNDGLASDSYNLSVSQSRWPATIWDAAVSTPISTLGPVAANAQSNFLIKVVVPPNATVNLMDTALVRLVSVGKPSLSRVCAVLSTSLGTALPLPFADDFAKATLDSNRWQITRGAPIVTDLGNNEPSPPYSLLLRGGDELETTTLNLAGQNSALLSYALQSFYTGSGDDLIISYFDGKIWVELARHTGGTNTSSRYSRHEVLLPVAAYHRRLKIRFTSEATSTSEYWLVDDVVIAQAPRLAVSPDSLQIAVLPGDRASRFLNLGNNGGSLLRFEISSQLLPGPESRFVRRFALTPPIRATIDPDAGQAPNAQNADQPLKSPDSRRNFSPQQTASLQRKGEIVSATLFDLTEVKILWDRSHGQNGVSGWTTVINDLKSRGATISENTFTISSTLLSNYDILWTQECTRYWESNEVAALQSWVQAGGALLVEGDDNIFYVNNFIPTEAGISYSASAGAAGTTTAIFSHPATVGIKQVAIVSPNASLQVSSPAVRLINDMGGATNAAAALLGAGKILVMADENFSDLAIAAADNQLFANQVFDWFTSKSVPWLSFKPASGQVQAGAQANIEIGFNPAGLTSNKDYRATIWISSNDPEKPNAPIAVKLSTIPPCETTTHFQFSANAGEGYLISVGRALLNGQDLQTCDEIGVFTPAGLCAGATLVIPQQPLAIVAWPDDPATPAIDGFRLGEKMQFRLWNSRAQTGAEYVAASTYTIGDGSFGFGDSTQIALLAASTLTSQTIPMRVDWNWISFNVDPADRAVSRAMASLKNLVILRNSTGKFYIPGVVDQINKLNPLEGYELRMSAPETLRVSGNQIAADTPIPAPAKWSSVSFLPQQPLAAETALASLLPHLSIAQDDSGHFYIPGTVNSIGQMRPGRGYKIHLSAPDTLIYPANAGVSKLQVLRRMAPAHFRMAPRSGESYSIVIKSISIPGGQVADGDEVGVFTAAGTLVGAGVWPATGGFALPAWRAHDEGEGRDGYLPGEAMRFKFWDARGNREIELTAQYESGDGTFEKTPYAVVALQAVAAPQSFVLAQNYPNPFGSAATSRLAGNPATKIKFALPQRSRVKITVYNMMGQEVRQLVDAVMEAGYHEATWDGANQLGKTVASGIYIYRMEAGSFKAQKQMAILR